MHLKISCVYVLIFASLIGAANTNAIAQSDPAVLKPIIDRAIFWAQLSDIVRKREPFKFYYMRHGVLKEETIRFNQKVLESPAKDIVNRIIDYWEQTGGGHPKHLGYLLGTSYRETCQTMLAGMEEPCGLTGEKRAGYLRSVKYGAPNKKGVSYYGRGLVQLTGEKNYAKIGNLLGLDLLSNPNIALEPDTSIKILVEGHRHSWFTHHRFDQYLDDTKSDWVGARNLVNPGSSRKAATGYFACRFYEAIQRASLTPAPKADVSCFTLKNTSN